MTTTARYRRDTGRRPVRPVPHVRGAPAVHFARIAGVLYCAAGIVGLAVTGLADLTTTSGAPVLGFEVNALANLLHLGVGVTLVVAASVGTESARLTTLLTAAAAGVAGLFGFAVIGTDANVLALNTASNNAHLVTAAIATIAAARTRRTAAS